MFHQPTRAMRRDASQLVCAIAGLALGLLLPRLQVGTQVDTGRAATMLFTIGFGVISLVSIIYSVLFLVVQFSATTFTPRLSLFRDEPIVWRAFAFAVGDFVFCITAGLSIGTRPTVSVIVPAAGMALTLVALALMWTLQLKAFTSIQLAHSLTAITTRAHRLYDALYEHPYDPGRTAPGSPPAATGSTGDTEKTTTGTTVVRWPGTATVLQQIDVPALVAAAKEHDCSIALRVTPGRTLSRGTALASVTGGRDLPERVVLGALVTGVERSFAQDPELPLRLLADIALRALSPAVNDPATAVESLDRLEDLLIRLAGRELDIGRIKDGTGRVRLTVPVPDWEQYIRTAVDDLVFATAGSPMALRRMRDLLGRLMEQSPESRRAVVRDRMRWVERTGSDTYPLVWTSHEAG
ncbi:DUF2254 domain-containing protein [Streptomyces sp. NBC_01310]|uniref:DUF2254 family protein n=1 Tax=Streptomyces sp. NBC_01310 TaxID=2903820 RepID=UPI0035B5F82A|nr:DUF2254 domain-containing protein [Streptomyces sp. NBC_01310]